MTNIMGGLTSNAQILQMSADSMDIKQLCQNFEVFVQDTATLVDCGSDDLSVGQCCLLLLVGVGVISEVGLRLIG